MAARTPLARIAWRNLWRNRRRTILTLISIAFGLFLTVLFTAMQDRNFADMIDMAARMGGGHVTVQHPEWQDTPTLTRTVPDADAVIELALADDGVERAVARIQGQGMVGTARESMGAMFLAYDPEVEDAETMQWAEGLVEGELFSGSDTTEVLLGRTLAKNLGAGVGDKVVYTLIDKHGDIAAGFGRVRGLITMGSSVADAGIMLLPIDRVREVLGYDEGEATHVALFTADSRRSPDVRDRVEPQLPGGSVALTWDEAQPELSSFITMKVGGAVFMEIIIMLLIAAGIFNTLFVSVMERVREFGIMIAIGFSPLQLFRLVMWESVWMGLVGVSLGGLVTTPVYVWLTRNPIDIGAMTDGASMDVAGVGMPPELRIGIFPENVALIVTFVVLATLLSGVWPAFKAGRVQPVDAINTV